MDNVMGDGDPRSLSAGWATGTRSMIAIGFRSEMPMCPRHQRFDEASPIVPGLASTDESGMPDVSQRLV
jgi:hypothetical protein